MKLKTLKSILNIEDRNKSYLEILNLLKELDNLEYIKCEMFEISEGTIPIIYITKDFKVNKFKFLKVFIGAQHNEYNGLFGILEFLEMIRDKNIDISNMILKDQMLIFAPLMNPYGFLHPQEDNKSGYYLKNGSNLNRFWRRTFTPEFKSGETDLIEYSIPEHAKLIKKVLQPYWDENDTAIYAIDFHETSLLERFPKELSMDLTPYYKFDHWLKEAVITNIINLYNIKHFREPLFYKCNRSADHDHINLSVKQLDTVREKLFEYLSNNYGRLPFYFVYSRKSQEYCTQLGENVYGKLKDVLWETTFPVYDHEFHDHGCLVKMNAATTRDKVYCVELESQKQFFDIFIEIKKSKTDPSYFENKLEFIDKSLRLVKETIMEMIKLF